MNNFRAKSNVVLGILFVLALLALIAVENSKVDVKQDWYNQKRTRRCRAPRCRRSRGWRARWR